MLLELLDRAEGAWRVDVDSPGDPTVKTTWIEVLKVRHYARLYQFVFHLALGGHVLALLTRRSPVPSRARILNGSHHSREEFRTPFLVSRSPLRQGGQRFSAGWFSTAQVDQTAWLARSSKLPGGPEIAMRLATGASGCWRRMLVMTSRAMQKGLLRQTVRRTVSWSLRYRPCRDISSQGNPRGHVGIPPARCRTA